jgi:general secretion pathway protein L
MAPAASLETDGLILLLPATAGEPWRCWRLNAQGVGPELAGQDLPECASVTVLVPSALAPVTDKPMPPMPEPQALAAERLALARNGLSSQRHVALGASAGRLLSARVANADMDRWLAMLAEAGIDPRALVPAALVLPRSEDDALVLGRIGDQLLARTGDAAFAAEEALVEALGEGRAQVAIDDAELLESLAQVHAAPPLNLRQGLYAPRRVSVFRTADWTGLARMAATAALLGLLLMLVWIVKWNLDSSAEEARALELAQTRFPAATDLDTAERLLAAELARRGEGGASFAAPTAALLDAMRPVPGVKLRDLGYGADGTLRFTAAAPRAEDVNAVLIALQNNGWKVTVPPALAPDPTGATVAAITLRAP